MSLAPAVGLLACLATLALTPVVRAVAWRLGAVAPPRPDRWHARPTALGGGIAIGLAPLLVLALERGWPAPAGALLAGATLMFAVGLADDIWRLPPWLKFLAQAGAALLLPLCGVRLGWSGLVPLDVALTLFWIVGITNAVNLCDNMDGLAAGLIGIAALTLCGLFTLQHQPGPARAAAALAGAALGFLVFNFKPASIFMGDVGALFLGYSVAGLALLAGRARPGPGGASLALLALPLTVPLLDTTYVTVRRTLAGRPFWIGGRDHTSHGLVALGLSERRAVLALYALGALAGADALLFAAGWRTAGLGLLLGLAGGVAALARALARLPGGRAPTPLSPAPGPPRTAARPRPLPQARRLP